MTNFIFKPSNEYRKLLVLDAISSNSSVTQRELASIAYISIGMINSVLDDYEKEGLITKKIVNTRTSKYLITKKGTEELKLLSVNLIKLSLEMYDNAKRECIRYLEELDKANIKDIMLYGAGKVCELIMHVIQEYKDFNFNVISIIDDDERKIGTNIFGFEVIGLEQIKFYKFDCIIITSYNHRDYMKDRISEYNINPNKIRSFFE